MPTLELPVPSEKQKQFLLADKKYVGFGGSRGGGKSFAVRMKAILLCLQYPGIKCLIIRKTYPELRENHINPLVTMLKCYSANKDERIAIYNDSKKTIAFPNGSRILFQYCDSDKNAERLQGTEADILFVDEATHQSEERVKKIIACVRGANNFPKRVYMTANPGSEGHAWFKRLFIDRQYHKGENPDDYMFIKSSVYDNVALMKENSDYVSQLEALPPLLRKMWLDGDWNVAEGVYFEEFRDDPDHYLDRQWTHVIEPFEIPDHWTVYRGFDWGYNRPFSCSWYCFSEDNIMYKFLEFYGVQRSKDGEDIANTGVRWHPQKVFEEIHKFETEHRWLKGKKIIGVADPAIWDAQYGESVAEVAAKNGVYFQKGDHERLAGWLQCHYRLAFDENGYPMFYVFKNCKSFIRTIPTLMCDEHRPEDVESSGEDHLADEFRYVAMSRPVLPRTAVKDDGYALSPLSMIFDIKKEDIIARPKMERMEIIRDGE